VLRCGLEKEPSGHVAETQKRPRQHDQQRQQSGNKADFKEFENPFPPFFS
jgi:hypothetical protein